jgi:cell division protein ZapA
VSPAKLKQIEVTIMGQSYVLGCPEGGEADLLEAVASVDGEMLAIRAKGKIKARERIAVLAALNLAYQLAGQSAASVASSLPEPSSGAIDIDALIRRVDQTLNEDGQLL